MFVLKCNIQIGDYNFTQVNDVRIKKSVDLLSDTATIKLPISAVLQNENEGFERRNLETVIKAGDPVSITLAYEDELEVNEFNGFVAFIKPNNPLLVLECEDAVYKIRKKRINKNFGKTTLSEVLNYIVKDTDVSLADKLPKVNFDKFLLKDVNGAVALQKLKDEYGLNIFIDDNGKLYAGLRQVVGTGDRVYYDLHQNIIKHNLTYRFEEDIRLRVKVIGIQKDNTKISVIVGDQDGEQRTIYRYNISDKAKLQEIGEAELNDLKYTGYNGTITSFFTPYSTRGMTAVLRDAIFPDRKGAYFVNTVIITFGVNGARRIVELSNKVDG